MSESPRVLLRRRAQDACEYCKLPQRASILPHQIDHIIARQHLGSDDESNLCLCCLRCNLKKGPTSHQRILISRTGIQLLPCFTLAVSDGRVILNYKKTVESKA